MSRLRIKTDDDDTDLATEPTEFLARKSKSFIQVKKNQNLQSKYEALKKQLASLYQNTMSQCIDFKQANLPSTYSTIPIEKMSQQDPVQMVIQLQNLITTIIGASKSSIQQLQSREQNFNYPQSETILHLENQIRNYILAEEKQKAYIECQHIALEELKKSQKELENEIQNSKDPQQPKKNQRRMSNHFGQELANINQKKSQISSMVSQIPIAQSISINTKNTDETKRSHQRLIMSATKTSSSNANKGMNQKLFSQVKFAFPSKETDYSKQTIDPKKLSIKVEDLEKENTQLKKQLKGIQAVLKKMKDEKEEEEKQQIYKEAISDKNPNLIDFYKKKADEKDREIKILTKSLKKFAVLEKKLLVKEKAFEIERAEYMDQVLYLNERVTKLAKSYQETQTNTQGRNLRQIQSTIHEE